MIVTADDYGYRAAYDGGILEVAHAGAVDAVSAMVLRGACEPAPLDETGVEVGLHLEGEADVAEQLARFEALFGRPPAFLDGHHHCHASARTREQVAQAAVRLGIAVRSIDAEHRRFLRERGVATPDRLVGRYDQADPPLPDELRALVEGRGEAPAGVTEWMVHPGHRDPDAGSDYDAGREEDLRLLLSLTRNSAMPAVRRTHRAALARVDPVG